MREKILDGYAKHVAEGKTIAELYSTVMAKIFGCTVNSGRNGVKQYFHPDGKPFPSFYQFSYWVRRGFVANELYKSRYGDARVREKLAANRGTFIESVSSIMERVELDGYYCPDRPVGVIEGSILPALCVVRATCVCSGMLVGIGFSLGSERLSAYKMALFSMAVGKTEFCKLFGIVVDEVAWPSVGMSPEIVMDRGPGATLNLDGLERYITVRDLAPSYSGQSKAVVESSHPRDIALNGEPSYLKSNLTVVEMAKREIFRLLAENDSSDASSRMTPEMWNSGVYPFPNSIWSFMESRARTSAYSMSLDKAVRLFLTEIEVTIERDGAYFNTRKFDSVEFRAAGIYEKASISRGRIKCKGYLMEMCVRHIWVEFGERLYKLDALLPIRDDVGQLYISIADLDLEVANRRKTESEFRRHKIAASGHQKQEFENNTGKSWADSDRKKGRPNNSLASQREFDDARRGFSGDKRSS